MEAMTIPAADYDQIVAVLKWAGDAPANLDIPERLRERTGEYIDDRLPELPGPTQIAYVELDNAGGLVAILDDEVETRMLLTRGD